MDGWGAGFDSFELSPDGRADVISLEQFINGNPFH
jgi:hypothetical protein